MNTHGAFFYIVLNSRGSHFSTLYSPSVLFSEVKKHTSFAETIEDHALFLRKNKRYAPAFECKGGCKFAKAIAKAGYATLPTYGQILVDLIKQRHLEQYDAMA